MSEVGLGWSYKAFKNEYLDKPPVGYLSVKGIGREAPQKMDVLKNLDTILVDRILDVTK